LVEIGENWELNRGRH